MQRKLGILSECIAGEDSLFTLERIKEHGFDAFFSNRYDAREAVALREKAEKLGLSFDFIHGPYHGSNTMWTEREPEVFLQMKAAVDGAHAAGVEAIIAHVSSGWTTPPVCDTGLRNFDMLVEYGEKKGVKIAFENLRKFGNLACLLERYENRESVGYCYDCGHEHCYTEVVPFVEIYGDRVLCTHIHDNMGRDHSNPEANGDMHLLPFDGNIDYALMMKRLNAAEYSRSLTLEVENSKYAHLSADEFLKEAFERIEKISKL